MDHTKLSPFPWQFTTVPFELRTNDSAAAIYGSPTKEGGAPLIADISRSSGDDFGIPNAEAIVLAVNNT